MGAPHAIRGRLEEQFRVMWKNPQVRLPDILDVFSICQQTAVDTAKRLGLKMRSHYRREAGLSSHGPLAPAKIREPYVIDTHGEKSSTPPAGITRRCPVCMGRESPDAPHRHAA